jgi:hypothetical protein
LQINHLAEQKISKSAISSANPRSRVNFYSLKQGRTCEYVVRFGERRGKGAAALDARLGKFGPCLFRAPHLMAGTCVTIELARAIASHTRPLPERISGALIWGVDEHVLTALAVGWWLGCRAKPLPQRHASDHVLLTTLASVLLPRLLKAHLDQIRSDRRT